MDEDATPALDALQRAAKRLGIDFAALVAQVGLWVAPEVHARNVTPTNPAGAVRPDVRRARLGSGEQPGKVVDGVRLDRNNYAGQAVRDALGVPRVKLAGYQACHVWPDTCYDQRYHTSLANLVLVPAPIVSLTDHDPGVIAALKFRSFELYSWHPVESPPPPRPPSYPTSWLAPAAAARHAATRPPPGPAERGVRGAGTTSVRAGSQREVMQRLWTRHGGNVDAVVRAWTEAVRAGEADRRSNERGQSDEEYAKRLIYDGRKRGWLA